MKSLLFIIWVIWGLLAVVFVQVIGHTKEEFHAFLWCGAGLFLGCMYLVLVKIKVSSSVSQKKNVFGCLILVLFVHFLFWYSNPILEDDYFRYSFDGRNSRLGEHPYANPPEYYFSQDSPEYTKKINHPNLRTIYAPIAQALFLSESLYPNTIYGWWILVIFSDICLVICTWIYIKKYNLHWHNFLIVWLNPIWLKEGLNSGHLDIMVAVFLWLAVYFSIKDSQKFKYLSVFFISLGVGVRPYLGIILAYLMKRNHLKYIIFGFLFLIVPWVILFTLPNAPELQKALQSWQIFVKRWEFNSLFFDFFYRLNKVFLTEWKWSRYLGWLLGCMVMAYIFWKSRHQKDFIFWGSLGVITWFLFQPTVNAWYFLPCIGVCGAHLIFFNIHENLYKGILSALAISLPMSYMHYLDIDRNFLDFRWALGEILIMALAFILFVLPYNRQKAQSPTK